MGNPLGSQSAFDVCGLNVTRHLAPGGTALLLKGRGAAVELTQAGKTWMMSADLMPSQSDPSGHVIKLTSIRPR